MQRSKARHNAASDVDYYRASYPRSEQSSQNSCSSRRHSSVRDDAQTNDEFLRKLRVARYMEEEKERSERSRIITSELDKWKKLREKERARRLGLMSGDEIADLLRREAAAAQTSSEEESYRNGKTGKALSRGNQGWQSGGAMSLDRQKVSGNSANTRTTPGNNVSRREPVTLHEENNTSSNAAVARAPQSSYRNNKDRSPLEDKLIALLATEDERASLSVKQLQRDVQQERQRRQEAERLAKSRPTPRSANDSSNAIAALQNEMRLIEADLQQQRSAAQAAVREKEKLVRLLNDARERNVSSGNREKEARTEQQIARLQDQIQDGEATIKCLKAEVQRLQEDIHRLRQPQAQTSPALLKDLAELERMNKERAAIIEELNAEVQALNDAMVRQRDAAARAEDEKNELKRALHEQGQRQQMDGERDLISFEELERRQEEMRQMRREDAQTIRELRSAVRSLEDGRGNDEAVYSPNDNDLHARLAEMRRMKEEDVATIHRLLDERDQLREELEYEKSRGCEDAVSSDKLESIRRHMRQNEERVTEAEEEILRLRERIRVLKEEKRRDEAEREEREREERRKRRDDTNALDESRRNEEEIRSLKRENRDLKAEVELVKEENVYLKRQLEEEINRRSESAAKAEEAPKSEPSTRREEEERVNEKSVSSSSNTEMRASTHETSHHSAQAAEEEFYPPGTLHAEEVVAPQIRQEEEKSTNSSLHTRNLTWVSTNGAIHSQEVVEPDEVLSESGYRHTSAYAQRQKTKGSC